MERRQQRHRQGPLTWQIFPNILLNIIIGIDYIFTYIRVIILSLAIIFLIADFLMHIFVFTYMCRFRLDFLINEFFLQGGSNCRSSQTNWTIIYGNSLSSSNA